LNFIRVSSLRLMYLHPSVNPSLRPTHFLGEFPGFGLALVPDLVVPGVRMKQKSRFKYLH